MNIKLNVKQQNTPITLGVKNAPPKVSGGFNYEKATNKPQIEGVELIGNRTFKQLGMDAMSVTDIEKILYLN